MFCFLIIIFFWCIIVAIFLFMTLINHIGSREISSKATLFYKNTETISQLRAHANEPLLSNNSIFEQP